MVSCVLRAALVLAVLVPSGASAGVHIRQVLTATGVDADARGHATIVVRQRRHGLVGKLAVAANRLDPDATFEVTVAGVRIGTLGTNARGKGRARFSTNPHGDQLLGVDPRGKQVAVHDEDGDDVLEGNMPDDGTDGSKIRCCLDDDDEVECEDRTPEQCAAEGGEDLGPGSCLPDPCNLGGPADQEVRCCTTDEGEPECEVSSAVECSEEGGVSLGAGTCEPNPCAPTPPGDRIRCCVPDGDEEEDEAECEQKSAEECTARGGTNLGPGSCEPDPCAGSADGGFIGDEVWVSLF